MKKRAAEVVRKTRETDIAIRLDLDGTGTYRVRTGLPFLDHMLELFSKHSLIDLSVKARGDLKVDYHHTVEDVGLALGTCLDRALGDRAGIVRYGWSYVTMDEALSRVVVDLGGRPYLVYQVATKRKKILDFDLSLMEEFFRALSVQARMNIHVNQLYGQEAHHAFESVFKAAGRALRMACAREGRDRGVPSTKGVI